MAPLVSPPMAMSPPPTALEPFLLLAKSARGAAAAQLVRNVIAASGVFVFGELLEVEGVRELSSSDNAAHCAAYAQLAVFAYGTYADYMEQALPPLSEAQTTKLRLLTLLTMAARRRTLSYTSLLTALALPTVRALESLIIDALGQNLLRGRLDQKHACFLLDGAPLISRDVRRDALASMSAVLARWTADRAERAMVEIVDKRMHEEARMWHERCAGDARFEAELERAVAAVKKTSGASAATAGKRGGSTMRGTARATALVGVATTSEWLMDVDHGNNVNVNATTDPLLSPMSPPSPGGTQMHMLARDESGSGSESDDDGDAAAVAAVDDTSNRVTSRQSESGVRNTRSRR